jgi:hypothetical protein
MALPEIQNKMTRSQGNGTFLHEHPALFGHGQFVPIKIGQGRDFYPLSMSRGADLPGPHGQNLLPLVGAGV